MENYTICNCMQVTRFDVENAMEKCEKFSDVEKTFDQVQAITHCSTGCGGCHDKILETISQIMYP
ncbi:MAG: (2Fe-2S)-binding protein [Oscillospiraceae bacterium]|nr:(2Fe-2S)-binding protein [Oscillospiraceae bacterium]